MRPRPGPARDRRPPLSRSCPWFSSLGPPRRHPPARLRRAPAFLALLVALASHLGGACGGQVECDGSAAGGGAAHEGALTRAAVERGGEAAATGRFVDMTEAAGIAFVHDAGRTDEKHLPETMGAGAALFDFDRDGDLDLYLVQSGPLPLRADRSAAPPNRLYAGRGEGTFEDITDASGDAAHRGYGMGAVAGDVDGDGFPDLFVTNLGPDALLIGDGTGVFRDTAVEAGVADPRWTSGAALFDPDEDGDLDLYVTAYVEVDLAHPPWCGERRPGWRSYCHPDRYSGLPDRFYVNDGRGRFRDGTTAAGFGGAPGKGLGAIALDADDDGHLDLYVANDSVENRLWRGRGDGTFEDWTLLSGTGVSGAGASEAGMGLAAGDLDGDGLVDLYVTNFDDESNTLYRSLGGGLFEDATARLGLDAPTRLPVGFGVVAADFDLDGDLDLAVANGHIVDNIDLYQDAKSWRQRALLLENTGGRFRDASALGGDWTRTPRVGRSLLDGDLDGDGDLDLVATECGGPARIFANVGPTGRSLTLAGLPRGTRVRARLSDGRVLTRLVGPRPSYLGSTAPDLVLGLGVARLTALAVRVPGQAERGVDLPAGETPGRLVLRPEGERWRASAPREKKKR